MTNIPKASDYHLATRKLLDKEMKRQNRNGQVSIGDLLNTHIDSLGYVGACLIAMQVEPDPDRLLSDFADGVRQAMALHLEHLMARTGSGETRQ